jgi:hypothetical protein
VLAELALGGEVAVKRKDGSESYTLTELGLERLGRIRSRCPVLPPLGKPALPSNDSLGRARQAYLLLKLFQSVKHTIWESDVHTSNKKEPLKLNHATSWQIRAKLAMGGHIALNWDGKEGSYSLTPSGLTYLTTLPFDELGEMKLKGSVLTQLLAAARAGAQPAEVEAGGAPRAEIQTAALTETQLEAAVMEIFHGLLRERFTVTGMVPIHEIRREIASRFGGQAASHAILDPTLLGLRRTKQLWLVSISDRSRATPEQLQDSLPGVGETFFYAEKTDAPAQDG